MSIIEIIMSIYSIISTTINYFLYNKGSQLDNIIFQKQDLIKQFTDRHISLIKDLHKINVNKESKAYLLDIIRRETIRRRTLTLLFDFNSPTAYMINLSFFHDNPELIPKMYYEHAMVNIPKKDNNWNNSKGILKTMIDDYKES